MTIVERLIAHFGGNQGNVARRLKADRALVSAWKKRGCIPANWAYIVERETSGAITAVNVLDAYVEKYPPILWGE